MTDPICNPMDVQGRKYVVTGASSGIGREISILLSELGGQVILVGRNRDRLEETHQKMHGTGHDVQSIDLSDFEGTEQWFSEVVARHGPLDGLVHSAGVTATLPLRSVRENDYHQMLDINVTAAIALAKAFCRKRAHREGGAIVFLSSVMGLVGQPGVSLYALSKGALNAFASSLALEMASKHVRVNCVAPGHVHTEMAEAFRASLPEEQVKAIDDKHPLGIGNPRDVANAVVFLLADTGRWITGTTLVVDGGYTAQ